MHVDNKTTKEIMKKHIHQSARIMTDEGSHYEWTGEYFNEHFTTKHSLKEYGRKMYDREDNLVDVHSNTAESYFSLIKRGFIGAFHKWEAQHIHRYCAEFDFRWIHRKKPDFERTIIAIRSAEGVRLTYDSLPEGSQT